MEVPAISPEQLAREIELAVAEFNRLAHLATKVGVSVDLTMLETQTIHGSAPLLTVSVRRAL